MQEALVVADDFVVEDGDVAAGCFEAEVAEQGSADVDWQPAVDQFGGEQSAEVVGFENQAGEDWVGLGDPANPQTPTDTAGTRPRP